MFIFYLANFDARGVVDHPEEVEAGRALESAPFASLSITARCRAKAPSLRRFKTELPQFGIARQWETWRNGSTALIWLSSS